MMLPDVNVLIYAFRRETEYHSDCRSLMDSLLNGATPFGISPQVLSSVVRLVTNGRLFPPPETLSKALEFCKTFLAHPHCQIIQPGPRHWSIFEDLCQRADARGNLITDAWFAALAIESGCEWVTYDRDYARFPGLRWRVPR
jgi:toxin-antitoxin system PIN domain toxin